MRLSPFLRQMLVALSPQLNAFSLGASIGFCGVLMHQLSSKDSSIKPDFNTLTWITSVHGIAGLGGLLMPSIMQMVGRKRSFIMSCLLLISGWLLAFAAPNASIVLMAECLLGFGCNCGTVINLMSLSEMLAPKYRTTSMMLLGIIQAAGLSLTTLMGNFIHWKTIALIMCLPIGIALIIAFKWPESPPWLAYKGRFDECEKSFKWLRGTDVKSMYELDALINAKKEERNYMQTTSLLKEIWHKLKMKDFIRPSIYMLLIFVNIYVSGAVYMHSFSQYILEIALNHNEKAVSLSVIILSGTVIIGAIISLFLIKKFNIKTVFGFSSLRIVFLLCGSLVFYFQKIGMLSKNPWYFVTCYEIYTLIYTSGLNSITFVLAIELMPVKHRSMGGSLYNILTCSLHFLTCKLLPYMFLWMDVWGTFLFFSINGIIWQLLIWRYVPETKNKTLLEIEQFYNNGCYNNSNNSNEDAHAHFIENKKLTNLNLHSTSLLFTETVKAS